MRLAITANIPLTKSRKLTDNKLLEYILHNGNDICNNSNIKAIKLSWNISIEEAFQYIDAIHTLQHQSSTTQKQL